MKIKIKFFIFIIFIFSHFLSFAKDRPSVALVLGGGGAKGFAELPVLEMLEEMDIPIDLIVGTSFGSIIGGMYAAGYSIGEIYENMANTNWNPLYNDYAVSPYESILGNHSLYNNLVHINLGLDMSLKLGKGLSNGQNVYELFKSFVLKYPSDLEFSQLKIPFKTVATDMLSGEAVILEKGDLAEAIRASMSIPGIFQPFIIDGKYYMDGGLRYNLPINVAKDLGYDIIIAIDVSQQVRSDPNSYDSNPAVAILNTITIAQTAITNAMYPDATIVIKPDMSSFSTFDFNKNKEIYEEGKKTAEEVRGEIEKIRQSIFPMDYDENGIRKSPYKKVSNISDYEFIENLIPSRLKIQGELPQDFKYINKVFDEIQGKELTSENFYDFVTNVYNTGNYVSLIPRVFKNDDETLMELILTQKTPKEAKVLLNSVFEQTVSTSSSTIFNLTGDIQLRGLTGIGSMFSLSATAITDYGASLYYFQPFNPYLFLAAETKYYQNRYSNISKLKLNTSNIKSYTSWINRLVFGLRTNGGNLVKIGSFLDSITSNWSTLLWDPFYSGYVDNYNHINQIDFEQKLKGNCFGFTIDYSINKNNEFGFPSKGLFTSFTSKLIFPIDSEISNSPSLITTIDLKTAFPVSENISILPSLFVGTDLTGNLVKQIELIPREGFSNFDRTYFPTIPNENQHGTIKVCSSIILQYKPVENLTILGGNLNFQLGFTAGNVTYDWKDIINFESAKNEYPVLWSSYFGVALGLKNNFGLLIRGGVGSTHEKSVTPFFALDAGSFKL